VRFVLRLAAALACIVAGVHAGLAQSGKRVALVMGNSAYQHTHALPNPRTDAQAIATLLRQAGFDEVTLKTDLDYRALREAVRAFGLTAQDADTALVYYAGHGLEIAGENYLVPTDARLLHRGDLEYEAVTLGSVLSAISWARRLRVVILDACRSNPLGEKIVLDGGLTRSLKRGLARIEPVGDVLVAYAAKAGTLAEDGSGKHSPYADALLKHIATPGLDVRLMFGKVRDHVLMATHRRQEPYTYGSLTGEVVALFPGTQPDTAEQVEMMFWTSVKDSQDPTVLATYLDRYPNGAFASIARALIATHERRMKSEQERREAEKRREEEATKAAEAKRAEEAAKAAEAKRQEEAAKAAEAKRIEDERRRAAQKAEEDKKLASAKQERPLPPAVEKDKTGPQTAGQQLAALHAPRPDHALSVAPGSGQVFRDRLADGRPCATCPDLVAAPQGEFLMGSALAEIAAVSAQRPDLAKFFGWEGPQRKVTMGRRFALGRTHVTRGEFAAFVAATGHKTGAGCYVNEGGDWKLDARRTWLSPGFDQTDAHPVVCVSWADANAYARWLRELTGRGYRLMSEAEAEYAARATTRAAPMPSYFFGNDPKDLCLYGNGASRTAIAALGWEPEQVAPCASGHLHTAPVASFSPNAWGFHDVHGNVWSWTADCWNDSLAKAATDGSAQATGDCGRRVVRGGSWANGPRDLRSAVRDSNAADDRTGNLGFRVARDID
jgi:formylglycine-generating enzyme required for sulfatase activity